MKCLNKESRVFDTLLSLYLGEGEGGRERESLATDPTPRHPSRPDTPTPLADPTPRHPDTPRKVQGCKPMQGGCKGVQADARGCKEMQGDANGKARREEARARGKQRGLGNLPKGAKR